MNQSRVFYDCFILPYDIGSAKDSVYNDIYIVFCNITVAVYITGKEFFVC